MVNKHKVLTWQEYFFGIAKLSALRSKDPHTRVGACIVDTNRHIVSIGYNGFPIGCSDEILPWERNADSQLDTKYPYVVHAEANAILNANCDVRGYSMYVTLFPCNECAKLLIQKGIVKVYYLEMLDSTIASRVSIEAAKRMFELAGVQLFYIECYESIVI